MATVTDPEKEGYIKYPKPAPCPEKEDRKVPVFKPVPIPKSV